MADQKQCPRLAQGPLLVSLVAPPWAVNLASLNKPDAALHPGGSQNLAGSLQGRGGSGDVSPKNVVSSLNTEAVCIDSPMLPSLEGTAAWIHASTRAGQAEEAPSEVSSAEGRLRFLSYPGITNLRTSPGLCISWLSPGCWISK